MLGLWRDWTDVPVSEGLVDAGCEFRFWDGTLFYQDFGRCVIVVLLSLLCILVYLDFFIRRKFDSVELISFKV